MTELVDVTANERLGNYLNLFRFKLILAKDSSYVRFLRQRTLSRTSRVQHFQTLHTENRQYSPGRFCRQSHKRIPLAARLALCRRRVCFHLRKLLVRKWFVTPHSPLESTQSR